MSPAPGRGGLRPVLLPRWHRPQMQASMRDGSRDARSASVTVPDARDARQPRHAHRPERRPAHRRSDPRRRYVEIEGMGHDYPPRGVGGVGRGLDGVRRRPRRGVARIGPPLGQRAHAAGLGGDGAPHRRTRVRMQSTAGHRRPHGGVRRPGPRQGAEGRSTPRPPVSGLLTADDGRSEAEVEDVRRGGVLDLEVEEEAARVIRAGVPCRCGTGREHQRPGSRQCSRRDPSKHTSTSTNHGDHAFRRGRVRVAASVQMPQVAMPVADQMISRAPDTPHRREHVETEPFVNPRVRPPRSDCGRSGDPMDTPGSRVEDRGMAEAASSTMGRRVFVGDAR